MPLVKIIADYGFIGKNLTEANFSSLEDARYESFGYCNFFVVNLPSILQLKN